VEWRLGGPGSTFAFPDPTDRFYGQHSASELPNGHMLLFDNGNYRPECQYSRALELALDFSTMTARKVWQYRHAPDFFSAAASNATRLANGNTLVNFAFPESPDDPVGVSEARADGTPAWEVALRLKGQRATSYRAYALDSLNGEVTVEPTASYRTGR